MLKQLKDIGLSENEAKTYIAMLELGPAPVLEIASKAGINRPTTYVQIESLKKKGLVSSVTKGKKQLFQAESPDQLDVLVSQEVANAKRHQEELSTILPDLKSLFNLADEKPQVRFFEGKEGLLRMQEEFLKVKSKEILGIFSMDQVNKIFTSYNTDYTKRRVAKKIKSKIIYTAASATDFKGEDKKLLREAKYIEPKKFPFKSDITIFDQHVAISNLEGKLSGTIITQKSIADSFRAIFDIVWKIAK